MASVMVETEPRIVPVHACNINMSPATNSVVNNVPVPTTAVLPLVNVTDVPVSCLLQVAMSLQLPAARLLKSPAAARAGATGKAASTSMTIMMALMNLAVAWVKACLCMVLIQLQFVEAGAFISAYLPRVQTG